MLVEWHGLLSGAVELVAYCVLTKLQIGFGVMLMSPQALDCIQKMSPNSQLSSTYRPLMWPWDMNLLSGMKFWQANWWFY